MTDNVAKGIVVISRTFEGYLGQEAHIDKKPNVMDQR